MKLLFATVALAGAHQAREPMQCHWESKQQCDPSSACRTVPNVTWAIADAATKDYRRCDRQGCDTYQALVSSSGAFTIFDVVGRGVFMKVGAGGAATEVVSLGNSVLVSQGTCQPTLIESR